MSDTLMHYEPTQVPSSANFKSGPQSMQGVEQARSDYVQQLAQLVFKTDDQKRAPQPQRRIGQGSLAAIRAEGMLQQSSPL